MTNNSFTEQETRLLLDALDAYLSSFDEKSLSGSLFAALLSDSKEQFEIRADKIRHEQDAKKRHVEDRVIILKAKILMMRDKDLIAETLEQLDHDRQ